MARPKKSPEAVADTRESLLDAAQALYEQGGSDVMSFRAIADSAGCSHSKLYSYFDSKADLVDALRLRTYRLLFETLSVAAATGANPLESLRTVAEAYVEFGLTKPRMYGLLYTDAGHMAEADRPLLDAKLAALGVCEHLVAAASDAGLIDLSTDPLSAAHIFWSGAHGLVELQLGGFLVAGRTIEDLTPELLSALIGGLSSTSR